MFVLLMAAAAANPTVPTLDKALTPDDYPAWAVNQEAWTAAAVDVLVDAKGRLTNCTTTATFGSERLGRDICTMIKGRLVPPGRDSSGNAVPSKISTLLRMFIWPANKRLRGLTRDADAVLAVASLPGGSRTAEVDVVLQVEPDGTISDCVAGPKASNTALVKAACAAYRGSTLGKLLDEAGQAVRYVTTRKVQLTTAPTPSSPPPNNSAANPR